MSYRYVIFGASDICMMQVGESSEILSRVKTLSFQVQYLVKQIWSISVRVLNLRRARC